MKILNLYAGIGGNRKLWSDEHEITAVDAILDTVLAHLPPKKIPALNKREEGYNVKELKDAKD